MADRTLTDRPRIGACIFFGAVASFWFIWTYMILTGGPT